MKMTHSINCNLIIRIKITMLSVLLILTCVPISVKSLLSLPNSHEIHKSMVFDNQLFDTEKQHRIELTENVNAERQELLQKVCNKFMRNRNRTVKDLNEEQMDHLLIDKGHKLLYCYVPKVSVSLQVLTLDFSKNY